MNFVQLDGVAANFLYNSFMDKGAAVFWENIKREIKQQNTTQEWVAKKAGINFNTFQGWIAKGIYPRVDDAVRIAFSLNTSVEYLISGADHDNKRALEVIRHHLPQALDHLEAIEQAIKKL
jgi:transcriptional regulator with XRE-family HTH domain